MTTIRATRDIAENEFGTHPAVKAGATAQVEDAWAVRRAYQAGAAKNASVAASTVTKPAK